MTLAEFNQNLQNNDKTLEGNHSMIMANVRGFKQFWNRKASDLHTMDEQFGPCTFFITLLYAEYLWPDLREYLEKLNTDIKIIETIKTNNLCAKDVVAVSENFYHRVQAIMSALLSKQN